MKSLLGLFLVLCFLTSCQDEVDEVLLQESSHLTYISIDKVPQLQSNLEEHLDISFGRDAIFSVAETDAESDYHINWNQILQLIEEDGGFSYSLFLEPKVK